MKKFRFFARAVCLLLCLVMIALLPPISVFADDSVSNLIGTSVPSGSFQSPNELSPIIGEAYEIIERRTPNEKFLRLEDGSYMAVKYAYDVHYLNGDTYEEYDNTMVSKQVGNTMSFVPKKSDINIAFSSSTSASSLFSVGKDDFDIMVSVYKNSGFEVMSTSSVKDSSSIEIADVSAVVENSSELTVRDKTLSTDKVDNITELTKVSSKVTYQNLLPKTTFEYTVFGKNVKEKIILQSASAGNNWQFKLSVSGVNAIAEDDGSISFRDEVSGEIKCIIPKGYMYDDAGKYSNGVTYTIRETAGGYILTVSADKTWIENSDRVFPVTVDPTFIIGGYTSTEVSDTYVVEGDPSRVSGIGYELMLTGNSKNDSDSLRQRILVKINELPEIPRSATVVSATLNLHQLESGKWYSYNGDVGSMDLVAKKVTSTWTEDVVCWNNQPTYSEDVLDYITVTSGTAAKIFDIDVTSAVQDWYDDPATNHGVLIQSNDESQHAYVGFISSENPRFATAQKPIYTISYRDTKGLDDRWAYSTQNAGIAGTGYINLFNRNLVFVHDDISTPGSILPINISHVYNSFQTGFQFTADNSNINAPITAAYKMHVGMGWKLSVCESIVEKTISGNTWLVYNDADGTELYFFDYDDGIVGNYQSEDGYALTIKIDNSSTLARYVLKDDYGNVKNFHSSGYITSILDIYGNKKTLAHTSGKLTYIRYKPAGTTGSINQLRFFYNNEGALCKIENCLDPTKYVEYYYSTTYNGEYSNDYSGYLRKIAYSSGESCIYSYSNASGWLQSVKDEAASTYVLYQRRESTITGVHERGPETVFGQSVSFTYQDKKTTVKTSGKDDQLHNSDDIKTVYLFDNFGRTVCTYVTDVNGNELYGASNAVYNKNDNATNPRKNNTLEKSSSSGYYTTNLLSNSSFETSTNWNMLPYSECTMEYSTEEAFLGNRSMKVSKTTTGAGSALTYQTSALPAGTYTFSVYVKAENVVPFTENGGASITFTNAGRSERITGTTDENIQGGWQRISLTHTYEYDFAAAMLELSFGGATGTVYFDCAQLERADGPSTYNLVTNGIISHGGTWTYSTNASYDSTAGINSSGSIKIVGGVDSEYYAKQTCLVNKPASSTSFMLSGWANGYSVTLEDDDSFSGNSSYVHEKRYFALRADIKYSDGTSETTYVDFNPNIRGEWQYASGIVMPSQSNFSKTISTVDVWAYYRYNANTACFDNISLTIEPAQTYTYDSNGQLTGVSSADGNNGTLVYEDTRLISQEAATGEKYTYTYVEDAEGNPTHDVKDVTSKAGVKVSYSYDSYGNVSAAQLKPTSGNLVIGTSSVYSYYGNFVSTVYDERGNYTSYNYNQATGLLNYVTNANNRRTSYIYDAAGRMTDLFEDWDKDGVFDSTEIGVSYVYNSQKQLQQIVTASTVYNFVYDEFGNCISITIGDNETPLATYTYGNRNGKLMSTTYADGTIVSNTYDELDRIDSVSYNGVVSYKVYYNGNGSVSMYDEVSTGRKYHYEYDSIGRLIRYRIQEGNTTLLSTENIYDNTGRLSSFKYIADGQPAKSEVYSYDTYGRLSSVNVDGTTISVSYDEFERINSKTHTKRVNGTDVSHSEDYRFYTLSGRTSTLVNGITVKHGDETIQDFSYVYDKVGNIQSVTSNTESYYYEYDDDILMTETTENFITDETIAYIYSYDNAGNILVKYQVDMDNDYAWVPISSYTYGNSEWGDLLTAVNGQTITYDANGNPLNYYNGESYTFTWQNGRRLASAVKGDTNVTYTYDSEGLRIAKTVNDSLHTYIYYDSILLYETWDDCYIECIYDASGSPMEIKYYDGTNLHEYYFVKNIQGDVTAIRDWNGNLIATYIYDAWGNVLSLTDGTGTPITSTTHIGYINPIRYRGYYYDVETGLYYLQSRYYDAKICRFINADGYVSTGQDILGNNMFAYCGNNPVNRMDESGKWWRIIPVIVNLVKKVVNLVNIQRAKNDPNNIYHGSTEQDVCTDGAELEDPNNYGDKSNLKETAYFGPLVAADKINYMVIPREYESSLLGCVGIVINNKTGVYAYGIVGESGPNVDGSSGVDYGKSAWDEVSIRMAWEVNGHEFGAPIANTRQYGDYTYIIFKNSKRPWDGNTITQSQIDAVGREYLRLY